MIYLRLQRIKIARPPPLTSSASRFLAVHWETTLPMSEVTL